MATYLLTWNPDTFEWISEVIGSEARALDRGLDSCGSWSTGRTRRIVAGDDFFLLRQGPEPRGIVASGVFTSEPEEDEHWDPEKAREGTTTFYADIALADLVDSWTNEPLAHGWLEREARETEWSPRKPGNEIGADEAVKIAAGWQRHLVGLGHGTLPIVAGLEQVRRNVSSFRSAVERDGFLTPPTSSSSRFWVFDASTGEFAPSKWCAFPSMSATRYSALQALQKDMGHFRGFDGRRARHHLTGSTGISFEPNRGLESRLVASLETLVGDGEPIAIARGRCFFLTIPGTDDEPESRKASNSELELALEFVLEENRELPDERRLPDKVRQARFLTGWRRATEGGRSYRPSALRKLTWMNLGNRLGNLLGDRSPETIERAFELATERSGAPKADRSRAKPSGPRDPNWTFEETILALELIQLCRPGVPQKGDPRISELSATLGALPIHPLDKKTEKFRNPAGVYMKINNLLSVETKPGRKGLKVSAMDRSVWDRFSTKPEEVAALAELIRSDEDLPAQPVDAPDNDEQFPEGGLVMRKHKRRERNRRYRPKVLARVRREHGSIICEACLEQSPIPEFEDAPFEVHHLAPLSELGRTTTRMKDLVLLCATCHRLIHALGRSGPSWPSLSELRGRMGG